MIHELLITGVYVGDGAYVDGKMFDYLLDQTIKSGIEVEVVYGDKAYFRKKILDSINGCGAKPYIPVSEMAKRINEERYTYN